MSDERNRTTDHETIRSWAEERGGRPARVEGTEDGSDGGGLLRIDFTDDDSLHPISRDDFFDAFEDNDLAMVYQDDTAEGRKATARSWSVGRSSAQGTHRAGLGHATSGHRGS